jgi:hypothetical protein
MKYLKKYILFLEQEDITSDDITSTSDNKINVENDKVNQESLDMIKKDLETYRSKKSVVENIFNDLTKSDTEIDDELEKNVFNNQRIANERNKYLGELVSLYKLKRRTDKISLSIETDNGRATETKRQIADLIERFNELENQEQKVKVDTQRKKSEEYLKELNSKINDNKKEFALSEKNYEKKKEDFEKMMKVEEEKIKNLQK